MATSQLETTPYVPLSERFAPHLLNGSRLGYLREILILAVGFTIYWLGRLPTSDQLSSALRHGQDVWHFERLVHLPSELSLQTLALRSEGLVHFLNTYYVSVHFPLTAAAVIWLIVRHPDVYLRARFALIGGTFAALAIQISYPTAPPRMLSDLGFVDTMRAIGPSAYGEVGSGAANQFAAMPSLHIGWATLCLIAAYSSKNRAATAFFLCHAIITTSVVVITANHYWLDGIVGAGLMILGWKLSTIKLPFRKIPATQK